MEFYIFEDDAVGRMVRDVLMEKAKQGVEVRVIYDDVGCWHVPNRFYRTDERGGSGSTQFPESTFSFVHQQGELPQPPQDCSH